MEKRYTPELMKLAAGLIEKGIPFKFDTIFKGGIITVEENGEYKWDAICHEGSYGQKQGLLEIMGTLVDEDKTGDTVEGFLTAEDILARI